ncbi:alpha/beta hydrolase [Salipaludibacillus aurantiacus]|uniref:Lysophospholipase, alpha-beta hydrolase superfamily n=1 Tax=Salipaludibacillus aurantiacus TaxID=1601833 RepID=A0A1H9WEA0_9BACI|nr:alpha/beta hydrolase [Salipaludibacillus aurantiacus]SES32242.1 Lysophospholipase, alpha-beta hydrolase superfamily [Salipaludibacillus aurantiacus]
MQENVSWVKDMEKEELDFQVNNPHLSSPVLQNYLSYYSFDLPSFNTYRCGTFKAGDKKIFIQAFLKKEPKGTVYFVHGYLDHTGGMSRTVNYLLAHGYEVVTLDLPGHGFSQGESGTVASFEEYIQAVRGGYELVSKSLKKEWIIGLGHSTGGAILFHAASEEKIRLEKLVLVAPLYHPYQWNLVKGSLKMMGKFIRKQKRRFKKNSNDHLYQSFIKKDPLQVQWLKSDWLTAMEKWQQQIITCPVLNIPVYFLQGEKDTTVDWKENVAFYLKKCTRIQVVYFPGGRHQLLNEREGIRNLVHKRILSFLNRR